MNNYLISEAIGDIAGSAYEGKSHRRRCRYSRCHCRPHDLCLLQKMPDALVCQAMKMLPDWMVDVSERFDEIVNSR